MSGVFGVRSIPPCDDCWDDGQCSMNCSRPAKYSGEALANRLREWPQEFGVMTPELATEIATIVEAAGYLVRNIREHGTHDNWNPLAKALEPLR